MNKDLAIHDTCHNPKCAHKKICYYLKRNDNIDENWDWNKFKDKNNLSKYNIFHVKSDVITKEYFNIIVSKISMGKNVGRVTIPITHIGDFEKYLEDICKIEGEKYRKPILDHYEFTCYTREEILKYPNFNKTFLIKDHQTYNIAYLLGTKCSNIHYPIALDFVTKNNMNLISYLVMLSINRSDITLDSCLMNVLYNNKCINEESYVDIDIRTGMYRKCPFAKFGTPILSSNIDDLYNSNIKNPECAWLTLFRKKE